MSWGGDWVHQSVNYSDPFHSALAMFFTGTMEGWLYMMQDAMNFNGVDNAPSYNAN